MSDLLDGPPIGGTCPSHASIPREPLSETEPWKAITRRQQRLHIASRLLAASAGNLLSDMVRSGAPVPADTPRLLDTCRKYGRAAVLLADALIELNEQHDRTPPPAQPAAVAVTGGPHTADCVKEAPDPRGTLAAYLLWVEKHQPVYFTVRPPMLTDAEKAICEREGLKLGLVCTDEKNRFQLTEDGKKAAEKLRPEPVALRLAEEDDAA